MIRLLKQGYLFLFMYLLMERMSVIFIFLMNDRFSRLAVGAADVSLLDFSPSFGLKHHRIYYSFIQGHKMILVTHC